ncbi:MAG: hypothetical protein ACT4PI_05290 [Actinomycetota bacterium]
MTTTETLIISGAATAGTVFSGTRHVLERFGFTRVSAGERAAGIRRENIDFVESLGLDPMTVLGYADWTERQTQAPMTEFAEELKAA